MRTRTALLAIATLSLPNGATAQAQAQPGGRTAVSREGIEALEAQLDRAVDRVSVPRPVALLGRPAARGYRLPGYGVVFVLSPRALPGDGLDGRPRHRVQLRHVRPLPPSANGEPPEVTSLEQQVVVLQQETEEARRAAEEDMDRIVQDVRVRLATPGEIQVEVATPDHAPAPAAPAAAPAPPAAPPPPATPVAAPPEAPLPPAPPWKFWFDSPMAGDDRTPEAVVADVREALLETLERAGSQVTGLQPEEFVTVAVDFERSGLLAQHARPARTLVVRARVRDCAARARGALPPQELRRRVEVIEY